MTQGTELARDFLSSVGGFLAPTTEGPGAKSSDRPFRLATIDAAFLSGMPRVRFDGETTLSGRGYPWVGDRTPRPNERVVLAPVGSGYVILGPPRLDVAQNTLPPYAEFDAAVTTGQTSGYKAFGAITLDASSSSSTVAVTSDGSNYITLRDPGLYSLSVYTYVSASTTGFTMVGTSPDATSQFAPQLSRGPFVNDNVSTLNLPLYYSKTPGQRLYFYYRLPDAITGITPRIRIGKLG